MKKILLLLSLIIIMMLGLVVFSFYSLLRENGFSTLLVRDTEFSVSDNSTVRGTFYPPYNNLGIVSIPLIIHGKGIIQFKIQEVNEDKPYYEATYNSNIFNSGKLFPFGFPPISNSAGKSFAVSVIAQDKNIGLGLNPDLSPVSKYVSEKSSLWTIFANKLLFSTGQITNLQYVLIILLSAVITISSMRITNAISKIKWLAFVKYFGYPVVFFTLFICSTFFSLNLQLGWFLFLSSFWVVGNIVLGYNKKTSFISALLSVILAVAYLAIGNTIISENLLIWAWTFLFMGAMLSLIPSFVASQDLIKKIVISVEANTSIYVSGIGAKKLVILVSVIVIAFGLFSKKYYLGGDDSKIFYVYPLDYFLNYVVNVGPNTAASSLTTWLPPSCLSAFVILMIFLKSIIGNLNLQMMLYVINFIGGILSFYFLLDYLIPDRNKYSFTAKIFGSLFYVYSIFNYYTIYNSQLIAQFLLSGFPFVLYCFVRAINERKRHFLVIVGIVATILCYMSLDLPWLAAAVISFAPFLFWIFWNNKKTFVLYCFLLAGIIILLNLNWLSVLQYSSINGTSNGPLSTINIASTGFREQNALGVMSLAGGNSVFFPLLNLYHYSIQNNYHWAYLSIFKNWYLNLIPLNILLFLLVVIPGIILKDKRQMKKLYLLSFGSFLISVFFFTANIGGWGINFFIWLVNNVPGFVMLRNMYDKFGISVSFSFAILLTVSLIIILPCISGFFRKRIFVITLVLILFLNAKPFIFNEFNNLPIWTTKNSYNSISGLNQDFLNLVDFVKNSPDASRYLWLPLNYGNTVQIQDKNQKNHYYTGASQLLALTGKNDYSGIMSFEVFGNEIREDILQHRFEFAGNLFRRLNVGYIIVNNTITPDLRQSYLCGEGLCYAQNNEYRKIILGEKIKDFGKRYSLYKINSQFANEKIYLTNKVTQFSSPSASVKYSKISNQEYNIKISNLYKSEFLVLLDPYFSQWSLFVGSKNINRGEHLRPFDYANGWEINIYNLKNKLSASDYIENPDGSISLNLRLRFEQTEFYAYGVCVTIFSFIIFGIYLIIKISKIQKKKI
jgi:hypothetical protein